MKANSGEVNVLVLTSNGPDETERLGRALALALEPGAVVLLCGELGTGKTVFAQGLARGLGVAAPVTSPTYTLICEYRDGRMPFYHLDLFRLEGSEPFEELGLEEYLYGDGVAAIEWPELLLERAVLPQEYLMVSLAHLGECKRSVEATAAGPRGKAWLECFGLALHGG